MYCVIFNHNFLEPFMINLESDREEIKPLDRYQILFVLCFDLFGHAASLNMSDNHHS